MGEFTTWQERLERHFSELAKARSNTEFPIFALEHGLNEAELKLVTQVLHSHLEKRQPLYPNWLVWVVYATEQGYAYDGDDYWGPFEHNTPYWREGASRYQIRHYFSKFQKTYNGVKPSGPWAEQFSIIAWPITNAILPRYLQTQFAKALHDIRHQLARLHDPNPKNVGHLLARNAWDATSRFQEFIEQEELAGQIVLALLELGDTLKQGPLHPQTLERIIVDLRRTRSAGEWLKEARRVVTDELKGANTGRPGTSREVGRSGQNSLSASEPPSVRPKLLLRRSGIVSWTPIMEVPNFNRVAQLNSGLTHFLKTTRCVLSGVDNAVFPPGWVLFGPQRRVMNSWPRSGSLMITFERKNAVLENVMHGECRFEQGPIWVFHIGSDGLAKEITGRIVRPGQEYVLLSREPLNLNVNFARLGSIECDGVSGTILTIPDAVEPTDIRELYRLGIHVARHIRIWPAGLSVRNWDGEGHGDWLTTDTPCFGIRHDYAVDQYRLCLNNGPTLTIDGIRAGNVIFIRLPSLHPGRHTLTVKAHRVGLPIESQALSDLEGRIHLNVRDPSPWRPGTTSHTGLAVSIDPPSPTLDEFWEGNVRLSVLGPDNRDVACSITLTDSNGSSVLSEAIGNFDLPLSQSNWTTRFRRFTNEESRAWKYLEAKAGKFLIKNEELGQFALPLERDSNPIRWICRVKHHETIIRLIDDTGSEDPAVVQYFPFKQPGESKTLNINSTVEGIAVPEPGGLFIARQSERSDALVVSSSRGLTGLHDLLVDPDMTSMPSDALLLLVYADSWHQARLAGPLAESRRERIVQRILSAVYKSLCGIQWQRAEDIFFENSRREYKVLERELVSRGSFSVVLSRDYRKILQGKSIGTGWYTEMAARYDVCHNLELCSFALKLAISPFGLSAVYSQKKLNELLDEIKKSPDVMCGARLVALHCIDSDSGNSLPYLPRIAW